MIFKTILLCISLVLVHGQENSEDSDEPKLQIIDGYNADPEEAKFTVRVFQEYDEGDTHHVGRCGGTLIDRRTVLTAAHCIYNATLEDSNGKVKIRYGTHDLSEPVFKEIYAEKFIAHKGYDGQTRFVKDDIAIIKLEKPVKKDRKRVSFAKLPKAKKYDYEAGTKVKVYGWGDTTEDHRRITPSKLLKTTLRIVEDDPIIDACPDKRAIFARYKKTRVGSGDSGGPLVIRKNVLIGVVSATLSAGNDPEIMPIDKFTKVESYLKWIKKNR